MTLRHFFLFFAIDRLGAPQNYFFYLKRVQKFDPKIYFLWPPKNGNFSKNVFLHLLILKIFTLSKFHSPMCWNGWDFRKKQTRKSLFLHWTIWESKCQKSDFVVFKVGPKLVNVNVYRLKTHITHVLDEIILKWIELYLAERHQTSIVNK